jgi:predicted thioredoxin/glutaredoxin
VGWALECKATRELDLAGAVDEALTEARNSGAPLAAAIVKRRRRPTSDAYVVMPLAQFARLVADEAR